MALCPSGLDPGDRSKSCAHILRQLRRCTHQQALPAHLIDVADCRGVLHLMGGGIFLPLRVDQATSPAPKPLQLAYTRCQALHQQGLTFTRAVKAESHVAHTPHLNSSSVTSHALSYKPKRNDSAARTHHRRASFPPPVFHAKGS